MSPEHILGVADIDGRTDVYGFGVLLYEALTGKVAFPGEPGPALFDRVLNEAAPPVALLRADLSPSERSRAILPDRQMKICGEHKLDFKGTLILRKCYAFLSKRRFARVAAKKIGSERS
jgi:serine/threonine-protein kinase